MPLWKSKDRSSGIKTWVGVAILLAIGLGMLSLSWRRWPDILVDFGGELYSPWQIADGAVLYKDIVSMFGPLSFYINASIFKIFGPSFINLAYFNILLIAILTLVIYRFFLFTTDRVSAVTASAVFLSMFAFSQYMGTGNYNFVCPYSHQLTHGILLSFIGIYIFAIYLRKRQDGLLFFAAVSAGLVFLAKSEVFIALAAAGLMGISLMAYIYRPEAKRLIRISILLITGFLLPVSVFVISLSRSIHMGGAVSGITAAYKQISGSGVISNIFYRRIMGTDAPLSNLQHMLTSGAYFLAAFLSLSLAGYALSKITEKKLKAIFVFALLGIVYVSANFMAEKVDWFNLFRGLPFVMLALGAYLVRSLFNDRKRKESGAQIIALFTMTVFGLLLLAKMALNVHIYHYGFAIALPSTLLLSAIFVYYAPILFGRSAEGKSAMRALGIILVSIIIIFHVAASVKMYNMKTFSVGSGADTIITFDPRMSIKGPCVKAALDEIDKLIKEDETFLVLPEGIMLNYLARRKNPYPHANIMPFELATIGEDAMLRSLAKADPDYIILVDRDTSEFGCRYFGKDYGMGIYKWVNNNYSPIWMVGNKPFSGYGFGIVITRRNRP